jgi:hypothetical protein
LGLEAIAKLLDTGEGCARAVVNWRSDWHPSRESQNRRPFEAQGRQGKQDAGATNGLFSRPEDPLIFIRLEMASTPCFLGFRAIFNRFRLSIRNGTLAAFAAIPSSA